MGLTLAQARTVVLDHVDDPSNALWSSTQCDYALASALGRCLDDYVTAGGDRFNLETTGTTSAADGTLSLSSVLPHKVVSVSVVQSNIYSPISPGQKVDREVLDTTARDLSISYVREYAIPADSSHPLVGVTSTAANTWSAFDHWVCARAAMQLAIKDNDKRPGLQLLEHDAASSVLSRCRVPASRAWPMAAMSAWADLRWTWLPGSSQLQLVRVYSSGVFG